MAQRLHAPALFLFLLPVGIGTGLLASYTLGATLSPREPAPIGIGVALLTVALVSWFMFFSEPPRVADARIGGILVACGTLCVLTALVLQFHLASLVGENSRRIAEILRERGGNVNLNADLPDTVRAISYLGLLTGIWIVALGVRLAAGRPEPAPARGAETPAFAAASHGDVDTGFRAR